MSKLLDFGSMRDEPHFDSDEKKNQENIKKHALSFEEVKPVFLDDYKLDFEDTSDEEERYNLIGTAYGIILFVVYTFREVDGVLKIRIISARKANQHEKSKYFQNRR